MTCDQTFIAQLWEAEATAAWVFVTVPRPIADEIEEHRRDHAAFGSVKVAVAVGDTTWCTSLFPDTCIGSYVLPVKHSVREVE